MDLREAREGDVELLLAMMRLLYEHDCVPFAEPQTRRVLLELLDWPEQGKVWLITVDTVVAGYIVLTFGFSLEYRGRRGFIDELFVTEPHRGPSRTLGRTAYERMGFREHGRRLMSRATGRNAES